MKLIPVNFEPQIGINYQLKAILSLLTFKCPTVVKGNLILLKVAKVATQKIKVIVFKCFFLTQHKNHQIIYIKTLIHIIIQFKY